MSRGRPSPRQSAGFTLVELLLSVTLMSVLLGLAYGGLRAATRASEQGQRLLEVSGGVRSAHQFVRRQLNQIQMLPFDVLLDAEGTRVVFEGDSQSVRFVGPMPGYLGSGGPQVQVLEFADGPDGAQLQFRHALLQGFEPGLLLDQEPIVLLESIESGGFEFMGRDDEGSLTNWTPVWKQPAALPVAVSLHVEFPPESQALWPVLVAGVRTDPGAMAEAMGEPESPYQEVIRRLIEDSPR